MTRPNVIYPTYGPVEFVGGLPSRYVPGGDPNLEEVHRGEVVGDPIFSEGRTWIRVSVPGIVDDLLVPVENLR